MLALGTIAFNEPWLVEWQIGLLERFLRDDFLHIVFDNSTDPAAAGEIEAIAERRSVTYRRLSYPLREHHYALNQAAKQLLDIGWVDQIGLLDHDIFPTRSTELGALIAPAGFFGLGQTHKPTGRHYLWPGFWFASRFWLGGCIVDFGGIRGASAEDNGDTGSGMWQVFASEEWQQMPRLEHGYRELREHLPEEHVQSWGVEVIGDWVHLGNGSGWLAIPDPEGRRRLVCELLGAL